MKKIIAIFLAVILLFALSGCEKTGKGGGGAQNSDTASGQDITLSLLYCDSDTFNPYTAVKTTNVQLCHLLFEPLFKVNNNFEAEYALAKTSELSGNKCTVTLKNTKFTDGSPVTADDVVYSFNLAKASDTVYSSSCAYIKSCVAQDSLTVVFSLVKSDPYFLNLLDFPILKAQSDKQTTSDGKPLPPIGCGRYIVNEKEAKLIRNESHYGEKSNIAEIMLIDAPDKESVAHYVEVGAADVYYTDLSDGEIIRMSSKKVSVPLNNLVFIGVNQNYAPLKNANLRYAISAAVDRTRIANSAYYSNAIPAKGIFHPNFKATEKFQTIETLANSKISIENLVKIGYNKLDSGGFRVNSNGNKLSLTLMVNKENQSRVIAAGLIAKQLGNVGISVQVDEVTFAQYNARLKSNNYQLYLGEVRILNNMDVTPLVVPSGSAAHGVVEQPVVSSVEGVIDTASVAYANLSELIGGFYGGKSTVADIATGVQTAMPIIPLCFRNGILFYDEEISGNISASLSDVFYSIAEFRK